MTTPYTKPLPTPSEESVPFWEGCKRHELLIQKCSQCGAHWFPPSVMCRECLSTEWTHVQASGKGRVYTFAIYHRVYHPSFADDVPYAIGVVELEEGPRMTTNIVGCAPHDVYCEMPVEVVFDDVTDEVTLFKFQPA